MRLPSPSACGDEDGCSDNARVITREEEAEVRARIDQENVHPNKQVMRRTAIAVHQHHPATHPHTLTTRSQSHGQQSLFSCGSRTIERLERELRRASQEPTVRKRSVQADLARKEMMLDNAIHFIDDVHKSVLRNGARWIIHADELSAKVINVPRTVLVPRGAECRTPSIIHSNRSRRETFTMIFATTASGAKLHPAVMIPADKGPRAMRSYDYLANSALILCGPRWFGRELWTHISSA